MRLKAGTPKATADRVEQFIPRLAQHQINCTIIPFSTAAEFARVQYNPNRPYSNLGGLTLNEAYETCWREKKLAA